MIVLASHLPGAGHAGFNITRHRVVPICCDDDYSYWQGVNEWWESDETLVILEHDLEVNDAHMDALGACAHPVCAWQYRGHWVTTGRSDGMFAHVRDGKPGQLSDEWADWSAIGLLKLTPEARTGALRREPWMALEDAVNDAITGPIHLHGPAVPHHHW